jgi:AcrR family transcriptional regulator
MEVHMAPRPDVSDQRRNQILDAATAVFARMGFERARMDDIADEAGVSKGALYLYYKSKDAIISTLLQFFFDRAIKQVRALAAGDGSVTAQLLTMTREMTREMERMAAIQPVALQFYAVAARQSVVRQRLRAYFAEYRDVLEEIIQRGIAQDEFRPTINPSEVAITISALLEGLALLWLIDPQGADWRPQVESSVHHLLQGIVAGPMPPA